MPYTLWGVCKGRGDPLIQDQTPHVKVTTMLVAPVITMLHNTTTDRWHPIIFAEKPLPGGGGMPTRHKSHGHHTTGFDTKREAEDHVRYDLIHQPELEGARLELDDVTEWDGEDTPAMVRFFLSPKQ